MADPANALLCAAVMAALWTAVGWPIARRLDDRAPAWCLAPALGFALHSVIALPLLGLVGMGRATVAIVSIACAALSFAASRSLKSSGGHQPWSPPLIATIVVAAALLALAP